MDTWEVEEVVAPAEEQQVEVFIFLIKSLNFRQNAIIYQI